MSTENNLLDGLSVAEIAELQAIKAERDAAKNRLENRTTYKDLVSETINACFPKIELTSSHLSAVKTDIYNAFNEALKMKAELFEVDNDQRSHTFTNKEGTRRITLGCHVTDNYDDTVNEGIAKVKKYIGSLAKDNESKMLVDGILRLLSKDAQGNLKASRVMLLRKMADESGNPEFIDGVKIISDAYRPAISKQYVRAEYKNDVGAWVSVPLGMTEA